MSNTSNPTLYLMLGYPGAGKTTASLTISQLTGAKHLWADQTRHELFKTPTYSEPENNQLYSLMNQQASQLLSAGHSVVFDTGFNKRTDRDHMRRLAEQAGAQVILIWIAVDTTTARERATTDSHLRESRPQGDMTPAEFERLRHKLELPAADEPYIQLDGTKISPQYVKTHLSID